MEKVIIDTNFLLECIKSRIDIFSELDRLLSSCDIYILDRSIKEIENLKIQEKKLVNLFLTKIKILNTLNFEEKGVDPILVKLSKEYIICTQDKELKKKLKSSYVIIRQKKYLELKN